MACLEFTVLYTHQKTKKSKVWQDGILKSTVGGNKATLLDDKGQILDSIFLKFQIKPGDELESERYLITVEDGKASGINSSDLPSVAKKSLTRSHLKPFASSSLHLPVGLKRKNTGFQGPRHVEKKMVAREEYAMIELPSSKFPDSPFAPHFQDSSPLFSVPYKKEGMNLFSTLNSNAFIQTNKDANSDTSWDCKPCVNEYKLAESTSSNIKGTDVDYVKPEFHLDTKMINSGYPIRNDGTISQNVRSKAQILELLNHRQTDSKHRKDERALRKSEFHQQSLHLSEPSRITSSLCQRKTVFLPECTDKTIKEGAGLILPLCSPEKNVHRKSRWDVYLSLPSAEKNPGEDDVEQNDNDLQNFKEDNIAESPFIENWQRNPCVPSSLEIENISAIRKSSVESLVDASLSTKSILNKGNDLETKSPFGNIHCSDSVNAAKTFQEKASKFNKHTVISDMDESCQLMQNDSCSVLYSENFSNSSTFDSQTESHQQITEVNFNLFDTLECSDTENEGVQADGILSQGTISFEKERETNGFSIQKNCVMHTYSSSQVENKVQDKGMDYVSRSQPLHIGNKVFQETNKMKRNIAAPQKSSQYSEITMVDKKIEAKAISSQNMNESKDLNCTDADFLIKNNRDSVVNNDYHNQTTWLQETEVIDCVPAISNSYSRNKSTEKSIKDETKISQPNSVGMHHITKPANPLLAFAKRNSSDYFFQCISEKKYAASEGLCDLDLRPIATSDISPISKMERVCVLDSFHKTDEEKEEDSLYVKPSNIDSSSLPQLVNRVSLLRSLTEHSTALESLQMLDESNSIICERGGLGKNDSLGSEGY